MIILPDFPLVWGVLRSDFSLPDLLKRWLRGSTEERRAAVNCHVERNDSQLGSNLTEGSSTINKRMMISCLCDFLSARIFIKSSLKTTSHFFQAVLDKQFSLKSFWVKHLVVGRWNRLERCVLWWWSCCRLHRMKTKLSLFVIVCGLSHFLKG